MTPIEIFVLVFSIVALVKLVVIAFNPKSWANVTKSVYKNPTLLLIIELILVGVLFYYMFQELSLIHIMAGVVLGALLTGLSLSALGKEIMPAVIKTLKPGMLKKAWLPILVWLVLIIWTLTKFF